MRYKIIHIVLAIFSSFMIYGQCPTGDVHLSKQNEVDNFVATYPNCTEINGMFEIGTILVGDFSDITDLSGLDDIATVNGDLSIWGNEQLTSLAGLEGLQSINGDLNLQGNDLLLAIQNLHRYWDQYCLDRN
jgi:hypothetical protein